MKLLRIAQVVELTGLKPSSIYKQIREGKFHREIKMTKRATAWSDKAVADWIEEIVAIAEVSGDDL